MEIKKYYKINSSSRLATQLLQHMHNYFVNKSIPYLQPVAMNLFWCSLDSTYNIGLSEQSILYQARKDFAIFEQYLAICAKRYKIEP